MLELRPLLELVDAEHRANVAAGLEAYVTRALDPSAAPSYGVPGDEE